MKASDDELGTVSRYRPRELRKNLSMTSMSSQSEKQMSNWPYTVQWKPRERENQSCYEKRTNFSLHCPGPGAVKAQGRVLNTTGTGGLSPGVQTSRGCLYLQGGTCIRLLLTLNLGVWSYIHWADMQMDLIRPSLQAQGFPRPLIPQYHRRNRKKSSLPRESWGKCGIHSKNLGH